MKKALIWNEDYKNRVAGDIEDIDSSEFIDSWDSNLRRKMIAIEVPAELENLEIYELKATPQGESYVLYRNDEAVKQQKMSEFRSLRDRLIEEADVEINKHIDGDVNAIGLESNWKAYRVSLRNATEQFKDGQNISNSIITADLEASLPSKPI